MVFDLIEKEFSFVSNRFGRNVIIWGENISSSVHVKNRTKIF